MSHSENFLNLVEVAVELRLFILIFAEIYVRRFSKRYN